jgi:hypothetical protein
MVFSLLRRLAGLEKPSQDNAEYINPTKGIDVRAHLPQLSVYLGHLEPAHTYWYLSATPELLNEAARSFAAYAIAGGEQ